MGAWGMGIGQGGIRHRGAFGRIYTYGGGMGMGGHNYTRAGGAYYNGGQGA